MRPNQPLGHLDHLALPNSSNHSASFSQPESSKKGAKARFSAIIHRVQAEIGRPSVLSTSSSSGDRSTDITDGETPRPGQYRTNTGRSSVWSPPENGVGDSENQGEKGGKEKAVSTVILDGDFGTEGSRRASYTHTGPDGSQDGDEHKSHVAADQAKATGWKNREPGRLLRTGRMIWYFFDMSYEEREKEKNFQKDQYYGRRYLAFAAAVFYLIMWAIFCALAPHPLNLYDKIAYICAYGVCTLPLIPMVLFNAPYNHPWLWQIWLFCAAWSLPELGIAELKLCNYFGAMFGNGDTHCQDRTEFIVFASAIGQPTLAILALGQNRLMATIGFLQYFGLTGGLLFGKSVPNAFYRDVVYFLIYHIFLVVHCFINERSARQLFELREQLKLQYKATQKAQVMEKKASDLTKRFVSYIFHEVRVPLNTALLSLQNLIGEGCFRKFNEDQHEMVDGLTGSLNMMEKVLNDVLSFTRMESGKFTQACAAFDMHKAVHLTALSHMISAQSKGIMLEEVLDPDIDRVGYQFTGDEMRLRQICSNLLSNAIKFTDSGGVRITTKLIKVETTHPAPHLPEPDLDHAEKGLVAGQACAIVRIEVKDTGLGLRWTYLADDRLFSPYVQTEIGRRQGGKGTGLGLALVRQIVQLSHGRLGVESQYGEGTTIWFEVPYKLVPHESSGVTDVESSPERSGSDGSTVYSNGEQMKVPGFAGHTILLTHPMSALKRSDDKDHLRPGRIDIDTSVQPASSQALDSAVTPENTFHDQNGITPTPSPGFISEDKDRRGSGSLIPLHRVNSRPTKRNYSARSVTSAAGTATNNASTGSPLKVLVVDDDRLTRMLMMRMIKRLGHEVDSAENGLQAFERIKSSYGGDQSSSARLDVVFLDNQMPLMTGVEVARQVRKSGYPLYIVGCTGNALLQDQEEYLGAGADRILTKPIKQAAVEECIIAARERAGVT